MLDLTLDFKTLTPLWTGDVHRNSDHVRETGLLGSLRWWYEGIVRGMGGYACDPLAESKRDRCEYDAKSKKPLAKQLCPACWLFGCTGWRRRFRLEVEGLEPQPLFFVASRGVYAVIGNWLWRMFGSEDTGGRKDGRGDRTSFTFGVSTLWGPQATLRLVPLVPDAEPVLDRVSFLLDTVSRWGALGAKPQNGFGQVMFPGLEVARIKRGCDGVWQDVEAYDQARRPKKDFFDLRYFFSHVYELVDPKPYAGSGQVIGDPRGFDYESFFIPCAFDIRYKSSSKNPFTGQGQDFGMRPWFRDRYGRRVANRLLGETRPRSDDQRSASRIGVSHLYRKETNGPWHLKVWGHVPPGLRHDDDELTSDDVATEVDAFIRGKGGMFPGSKLVARYKREEVLER